MHFEDFIEQMTEEQYETWYGIEATDRQKSVADRIREEVSEEEAINEPATVERNRFLDFFRRVFRR